jgi:hypothetical protein
VSIVRIGLGETKHFAEGYEAIFRKKKGKREKKPAGRRKATKPKRKKTKR